MLDLILAGISATPVDGKVTRFIQNNDSIPQIIQIKRSRYECASVVINAQGNN